jgi:hypothetical protein
MKPMILSLLMFVSACATSSKQPRAEAGGIGPLHANFSRYQTFAFGPANPPAAGYQINQRSMLVQAKLAPMVQSALEKRGYALKADHADLVVKISAGSGEIALNAVDTRGLDTTPAGFISVDAYDARTGAYVWHGAAFAEIDRERIDLELLARGVESMLGAFPAK